MIKILTAKEMKEVDNYSINELKIPALALMESAARSVALEIKKDRCISDKIVAVCGIGNNGADGVAVIRLLKSMGYENTDIIIIGDISKGTEEFKIQTDIAGRLDISISNYTEDIQDVNLSAYDVIVDGLFGIGLSREVTGVYYEVIKNINNSTAKKYAVDIPSGIDGNNGNILGIAVKADYTITFGSYKAGLVLYPGAEYAGEVKIYDIGFPDKAYENRKIIYSYTEEDLYESLPVRKPHSNKGSYGKLVIIAGNEDMYGACYMCSRASFALGTGLIKILTTKENKYLLNEKLPEAIVVTYDDDNYSEIIKKELTWCDTILVGPGIGATKRSENIVKLCLKEKKNTIIDADGINVISGSDTLKEMLHDKVVLTPHLGEMSRLINMSISDISKDMIKVCKKWADALGVSIVMKDSHTIICNTRDEIFINLTGNSGMAKAGSGDVLAGIMAGLVSTGVEINKAAAVAPFIHGISGNIAKRKQGEYAMLPTDIISAMEYLNKCIIH